MERQLVFCRQVGLRVAGLVENMSGYRCPHCSDCSNLFSSRGGQSLASKHGIPLLGTLPIDPRLGDLLDGMRGTSAGEVGAGERSGPPKADDERSSTDSLSTRYRQGIPELHKVMSEIALQILPLN